MRHLDKINVKKGLIIMFAQVLCAFQMTSSIFLFIGVLRETLRQSANSRASAMPDVVNFISSEEGEAG